MKLKTVKIAILKNVGYAVAATFSLCLVAASLVPVGAQKAHRRITSLWTATSAEGSRVTVASDSSLNDSEAYTRGDRFYVKIPLADLPSTTGSLLGRGFEDVQIQRVGDGVLLSFRLQSGTTARVDRKLNRIEVVFSVPSRSQPYASSAAEAANRPRSRRTGDTAGPAPPPTTGRGNQIGAGSLAKHAERGARTTASTPKPAPEATRGNSRNSASDKPKPLKDKVVASSSGANSKPTKPVRPSASPTPARSSVSTGTTGKAATPSPSPLPTASPSASPTPVTSPTRALATASPTGSPIAGAVTASSASPATTPTESPTPVASSAGTTDWASRLHYYKEWVRLNPIPLVIAGLAFVALLLLLFVRGGSRRRRGGKTERDAKPVTPPPAPAKQNQNPVMNEPASTVARQNRVEGSSAKPLNSPVASNHAGEDPDREVFEL